MARTRRGRAEQLLRTAEGFGQGAEGAQATAQVLASLPSDEWRVFHDVRWPARRSMNIDHVVVGPTGVFVIDAKVWSGRIEVRSGSLRHEGHRRSRSVVAAAAAAMSVSALVPRLDIKAVNPVICFVRDEPLFGWSGDVMVCSTENLVAFLTSRPRVFDESEVAEIAGALSGPLKAAPVRVRPLGRDGRGPAPPSLAPPSLDPPPPPQKDRRTRNRRLGRAPLPGPVRVLLKLGLVVVVVAVGFRLDIPAKIGDLSSEATQRVIAPTKPIGTAVPVPAMGSRPSLEVTAGMPVITTSAIDNVRPQQGHQLVAIPLRIENTGDSVWTSNADLDTGVTDQAGVGYSSDPAYSTVAAGNALPANIKLRAGRTTTGYVVFEVPRGTQVTKVRVSVGPGLAKLLRWSVS
jgi:hypothetical protein